MTRRHLAVLLPVALAAGWAAGWFVLGPLIGLYLVPAGGGAVRVPSPVVSSPVSSRSSAPRHRVSVPPVPARRTSHPAVTYAPRHARPRPHSTPTPAPTVKIPAPAPTPTPTPSAVPSTAPSALPSSVTPSGTVPAVMPTVTDQTPPGSP